MNQIIRKNERGLTELRLDDPSGSAGERFSSVAEFVAALESSNASIECVRLEGDFLKELSPPTKKGVLNAVGRLPLLREVRLCGAGNLRVNYLAELVGNARQLTVLDVQRVVLEGNQEDFAKLEVVLYKHVHLEQFVLVDFAVQSSVEVSFDRLVQALGMIRTIQVVKLGYYGEQSGPLPSLNLGKKLLQSKTLKELHISGFGVDRDSTKRVAQAVETAQGTALKTVSLCLAGLNDEAAKRLALALGHNNDSGLEVLELCGNRITSEGCIALAECLQVNKSIQTIGLAGNESIEDCVVATMEAMLRPSKRGGAMVLPASLSHNHAMAA